MRGVTLIPGCPRIYFVKLRLSLTFVGLCFARLSRQTFALRSWAKRYCRTTNYHDLIRPPSINLSFVKSSVPLIQLPDLNCSRSLAEDVSRTESNTIFCLLPLLLWGWVAHQFWPQSQLCRREIHYSLGIDLNQCPCSNPVTTLFSIQIGCELLLGKEYCGRLVLPGPSKERE